MGRYDRYIKPEINRSGGFFDVIETGQIEDDRKPSFSYEYLIVDPQELYSSSHNHCELVDFREYFVKIKQISSKTMSLLKEDYRYHFHYEMPRRNSLSLLLKAVGKTRLTPEQTPFVGQFSIYTPDEWIEGGKCPRAHFFLGKNAVLYIIGFDIYHTIKPMRN